MDSAGAEKWSAEWARSFTPPTDINNPVVLVLDLTGITPSIAALENTLTGLTPLLGHQYQRSLVLIVATEDPSIRNFVRMFASQGRFPLYLSNSPSPVAVMAAEPVGELTETERATLTAIERLHGRVTARELSELLDIKPTATNNRLSDLETRGLVFRQHRPGRNADVFIDYRVASFEHAQNTLNVSNVLESPL